MKIGILTQPLANNYGGILQNFALQLVLKRMGHTPVTINIPYRKLEEKTNWPSFFWRFFKRIKGDKRILFINANKQMNFFNTPGQNQMIFIRKNLLVENAIDGSPVFFQTERDFDAIIVGSDQVWRKAFSPDLPAFFFRDVPNSTKKITYGVSFGTSKSDIPQEEISYYKSLVQNIHSISVREKSGIDICKKLFDVDAELVLDPTLLLNPDDYIKLLNIKGNSYTNTLAIYLLDRNKDKDNLIRTICKELGLCPTYIGTPSKKGFPSIESWMTEIKNSRFMITDSFHGTVFSIIFNKQFITLSNKGRGNSRMETLLEIVNLQDRMICAESPILPATWLSKIDYTDVNRRLSLLKIESINFLQKALS